MMADFKKRVSAPDGNNPYYKHYSKGGYNTCIVIDNNTGSVIPNCVGYSNGRLQELNGKQKVDWRIPAGNPDTWIKTAKSSGLTTGTEPRLGAVAVWTGHVANVEAIDVNGNITISQSHYYSKVAFDTIVVNRTGGYMWEGQRLLGFVYPDVNYGTGDWGKTVEPTKSAVMYYVQSGAYGVKANARKQMDRLSEKHFNCICKFDGTYYRVQCGAYSVKENALLMVEKLKASGFGAIVSTNAGGKQVTIK